jgi:soluble lytic murein transglycosylase-like protein
VVGLAVEVRVRRAALRVPVPALAGGGAVRVAPRALARAVLAGGLPAGTDALAADGLPVDVPAPYRLPLLAAAARERLPPVLLAAQLRAESGWDPSAVSRAGAQGLAQFMPGTWAGSWNPWRDGSPFDPAAAIPAQARYLRLLLDAAHGDVGRALAFYNAGQGGAAGPPATWPDETRVYVAAILARTGLAGEGASSAVLPLGPPVLRLIG